MNEEIVLEKKYRKMIATIDKVAKMYCFNYIHNLNIKTKGSYYIDNNNLSICFNASKDFEYVEGISFIEAILRAFSLRLNIEINPNAKNYELINLYCDSEIIELNNEIEKILIKSNSIVLGEINYNDNTFNAIIDLNNFFNLILSKCKAIIINDYLHVIFITDKKASKLCYQAMNVCRMCGLTCKMVYEDFDDSEIEPTKFLVDFDEETTKNHTVNIKDMLTQEIEEIDIDEIYPYVMKKMFAFSKCNNCSEV